MKTVNSTIILPMLFILFVPNAWGQGLGVSINPPISMLHVYENTTNTGVTAGLTVEQDGTGDAVVQFLLTGGRRWVMGLDNSDGDKLKIGTAAGAVDLSTDEVVTITTAGAVGIGVSGPTQELAVNGTIIGGFGMIDVALTRDDLANDNHTAIIVAANPSDNTVRIRVNGSRNQSIGGLDLQANWQAWASMGVPDGGARGQDHVGIGGFGPRWG